MILLLLACTPDDKPADTGTDSGTPEEAFHDPSAPGPWPVGTDARTITGTWGVSITVQAWFPRDSTEGAVHEYDDLVPGGALDGGQADCASPRPVLLFSHGNGGMRWQSFFLAEHFASHGFLVLAPDHTFNTIFDLDDERRYELVFRRPVDIADTFDLLLERVADPEDRLYGCADPDAGYAIAGHSFGGYTTMAVAGAAIDSDQTAAWCAANGGWLCEDVATWAQLNPGQTVFDLSDPRAWAAIPMAPAGYEALIGGLPDITAPSLVLGGSRDTLTTWEGEVYPIYADLQAHPRAAALVIDAGHYSFSDACALVPSFADCAPPYLPPEEVQQIAKTLALAWVQAERGFDQAGDWLPGAVDGVEWESVD